MSSDSSITTALDPLAIITECEWDAVLFTTYALSLSFFENRISLGYQLERWRRFKDREFRVWMADILERWIIGQHLSVGTLRYDGFTQRLRFSLEESGLEFYADRPFRPDISRDHLAAALALMTEVKLVDRDEDDIFHSR